MTCAVSRNGVSPEGAEGTAKGGGGGAVSSWCGVLSPNSSGLCLTSGNITHWMLSRLNHTACWRPWVTLICHLRSRGFGKAQRPIQSHCCCAKAGVWAPSPSEVLARYILLGLFVAHSASCREENLLFLANLPAELSPAPSCRELNLHLGRVGFVEPSPGCGQMPL